MFAPRFSHHLSRGPYRMFRIISAHRMGALLVCALSTVAAAQAALIKDLNPATPVAASNPNLFTPVGSTTYFVASDVMNGAELWKTDGTAAGTVLVRDICPGQCSGGISSPVSFNGAVYFFANDGSSGTELWKSDGSSG